MDPPSMKLDWRRRNPRPGCTGVLQRCLLQRCLTPSRASDTFAGVRGV
jgi:hypothetical protein